MRKKAQTILADALELPRRERVTLASELLASVDGPPDPDWERAWLQELERRVRIADEGGPQSSGWGEARARILRRLARR